ncbi:hypothetical protein KEJ15_03825 [Candidatus Bathyarchaeota archaeon]|nr:hypothetical protein [Candidatus Bathyarchaeota archaeon]
MKMYFAHPPLASGMVLASNIEFEFKGLDLTDLPLNFSVGDFEYLRTVKYEVIHWGTQGCFARVNCRYSNEVSNNTAEGQAEFIANKVLAMFNQQQLDCVYSRLIRDGDTGELVALRDYGYFPESAITDILKRKPQNGLSGLITESFLSRFKVGEHITFVNLEYTLYKSYWNFDFEVCMDLLWNGADEIINLDVNAMLASGPIAASSDRRALISLVLYKYSEESDIVYSLSLDEITPPNYTEREEDKYTLVVTYDLSLMEPIQVNAKVNIFVEQKENSSSKLFILSGVILSITAISLIAVFTIVRRRRRRKTSDKDSIAGSRTIALFNAYFAKHESTFRTTLAGKRNSQQKYQIPCGNH